MIRHKAGWLLAALLWLALLSACDAQNDTRTATDTAQNYERGFEAYQRGDYPTALEELRPLAEQGDPTAQLYLGEMYEYGEGVTQDYAEAAKWYRLAAEQGDAGGQYKLGVLHTEGKGVPQDYAEAENWYRLAAEQNDADAQFNLGVMYDRGDGVTKDYAEAGKWYRLAAKQGNTRAQFNLGLIWGLAVQDYAEAAKWFRLAADQGDANAQFALSALHIKGDGVPQDNVQAHMWLTLALTRINMGEQRWKYFSADDTRAPTANLLNELEKDMTPEQIAEAQRLAREWKPK